jgi:colanic acid/amylovoran biosynthesis glycosyltransferase
MQLHVLIMMMSIGFMSHGIQAVEPLKILFVVGFFPCPTEHFILNQITALIDRGHEVSIYACDGKNPKNCHPDIMRYNLLEHTIYRDASALSLPDYDVIYVQFGVHGMHMVREQKKQKTAVPMVTCFRGVDITQCLKKKPHMYDELLRCGDLFLPVSDQFTQQIIDLGAPEHTVITHHSALDMRLFEYRGARMREGSPIHFISVSRLIEKKGIEYAIKAFKKVHDQYANTHYTIVGGGALEKKLRTLTKELQLQDAITFTGALPHGAVIALLRTADSMVLPCIVARNGNADGIPNALKEAMAIGLPVISTTQQGITELVEHGVSGYLVPERDSGALADAMIQMIHHVDQWEAMGRAARAVIEREYALDEHITRLENYFYALKK